MIIIRATPSKSEVLSQHSCRFPPSPHLVFVLQQISLLLRVVQLLALSVPFQAVILLAGGGGVEG